MNQDFRKNITLTQIRPIYLGKIKPYQNLSILITFFLFILILTLFQIENNFVKELTVILIFLCIGTTAISLLLSLPFIFSQKKDFANISNGVISIEIDHKVLKFNSKDLKFVINIERKNLGTLFSINPNVSKYFSNWGNFIVIPSNGSGEEQYIEFIPNEDIFKIIPQLRIVPKKKSFLNQNSNEIFENFKAFMSSFF